MSNQGLPLLFHVLSHELRWQLVSLLAQSDYRVHELVALVDRPTNLVSYHLGKLRKSQVVCERRSSADGRDVYYSLDLNRLGSLFQEAGHELHPSLWPETNTVQSMEDGGTQPSRVLFLCTRNSARSQMAEGLLRHIARERARVFSAGDLPSGVHPFAVQAMADMGIDISDQYAKHKDIFDGQSFDYVVTVCDFARENCPVFANEPAHIHWSIPDPVEERQDATAGDDYSAFRAVAQTLETRVHHLYSHIATSTRSHDGRSEITRTEREGTKY
jgi:protein-tyrosine-phosphatase